jgi:hypothetical protein
MSPRDPFASGDLSSDLPEDERAGLSSFGDGLLRERPVPSATFRGELRRMLLRAPSLARPRHLRRLVAAYLLAGTVLLLVAAAGLASAGPFASTREEHPTAVASLR